MPEMNIDTVLFELKKTNEALRAYVDRQIEDVRGITVSDPLLKESIEKANNQLGELRALYDDLAKERNRPAGMFSSGEGLTPEQLTVRSAFAKFVRYGTDNNKDPLTQDEIRALSNAADTDGGTLIPPDYEAELIMAGFNEAAIRPVVGARPTSRDNVQMSALAKPMVGWGTNGLAVDPQVLKSGGHNIPIRDLKALALIPNNTLEDAEADIWAELNDAFGDAINEAEDDGFAVGSGVNSPQGIIVDEKVKTQVTVSGVSGGLTDSDNNGIDVLIKALYKLRKTYRRNATFACNSSTEGLIRVMKNGNGDYLWQPPVQAGDPSTLLGKPIINPEGLPDAGTNGLLPIVVGDFKRGYRIRDRSGITVMRLTEKYAEYGHTGFLLSRRTGGKVVLAEAFQCIKVGTS